MNRKETKARLIELGVKPSKLEKNPWDLIGASLNGACIIGANLNGASLFRASLFRASLDGASLDGTCLDGTCLIGAKGLTADQLARTKNLEHSYLDPGRYADAVAAGYKPEK